MPYFVVNIKVHSDFMHKCFLLNHEEAYNDKNYKVTHKMTPSVVHLPPMQTLLQNVKPTPKTSVRKEIPLYFL